MTPHRLATIVTLLAGCASAGTGTANVLEAGDQEVGFGVELATGFAKRSPTQRAPFPWPYMSASYRRGLGRQVDLGARVWGMTTPGLHTFGGAADTKIGLKQLDPDVRGWEAALNPSVGYHQVNIGGAPAHVGLASVGLLGGLNRGGGDQFAFGPRVDYQLLAGPDLHPVHIVLGGGSVAYNWRLAPSVELRPQAVVLWSPVRFNGTLADPDRRGYSYLSLGIGAFVDVWNL